MTAKALAERRTSPGGEIGRCRIQRRVRCTDLARDQVRLFRWRPDAHCKVRLAPGQIDGRRARREVDRQLRMERLQLGEVWREKYVCDELARRQPNDAGDTRVGTRQLPFD